MKKIKTNYKVVENVEATELNISCGSKMLIKQLIENHEGTVGDNFKLAKLLRDKVFEITDEEKKLINFVDKNKSYDPRLDNSDENVKKFKPVMFDEFLVTFIMSKLTNIALDAKYAQNLNFLTILFDAGLLEYTEIEFLETKEGKEGVSFELNEYPSDHEFLDVTEKDDFDAIQLSMIMSKIISSDVSNGIGVEYVAKTNYVSNLALKTVEGSKEEAIELYRIFDTFFDIEATILSVKDIIIIGKYLNYSFE